MESKKWRGESLGPASLALRLVNPGEWLKESASRVENNL